MQIVFLNLSLTTQVTLLICGLIIIISAIGTINRKRAYDQGQPVGPVTSLASGVVISLGIFGTFLGIYLGLRNLVLLQFS